MFIVIFGVWSVSVLFHPGTSKNQSTILVVVLAGLQKCLRQRLVSQRNPDKKWAPSAESSDSTAEEIVPQVANTEAIRSSFVGTADAVTAAVLTDERQFLPPIAESIDPSIRSRLTTLIREKNSAAAEITVEQAILTGDRWIRCFDVMTGKIYFYNHVRLLRVRCTSLIIFMPSVVRQERVCG